MKKSILLLCILLLNIIAFSQSHLPSYPEVLRYFFKHYSHDNLYDGYLNFAKKKNGWYVQLVDQSANDSVLSEELFWPAKDNAYLILHNDYYKPGEYADIDKQLSPYLAYGAATYNWIDYERCIYAGYNGWELDIIKDLENKTNLPDTLLESLARAYSSNASSYLWYQYGGQNTISDTLREKLGRLQLPSQARIEKVNYFIHKGIEAYRRLALQNPDYTTLIGPVALKEFNELMFGYNQMIMALNNEEAKKYIEEIKLDSPYIIQAKNYLNSCAPNAILFSYGDNDTYQLWYVQQKENYRKDVTVINNSLLGLPIYIDMLKKTGAVNFAADASLYADRLSDISYFEKGNRIDEDKAAAVSQLIKAIREKKYPDSSSVPNTVLTTYPYKSVSFDAVNARGIKDEDDTSDFDLSSTLPVLKLGDRLYINDYMIFDIINQNLTHRPIYFTTSSTTYFDDYLQPSGIVYKFTGVIPGNTDLVDDAVEKNLENFVETIYRAPIINFKGKKIITYDDGRNSFYSLYSKIADHYADKNDNEMALSWLNKAMSTVNLSISSMPQAFCLAGSFCKAGDFKTGSRIYELYAAYFYKLYTSPSAVTGYVSKNDCVSYLESIVSYLEGNNIDTARIKLYIEKIKAVK